MWNPFKTSNQRTTGQKYENQACHYLQGQGLTLKARNINFRCGEIDLIMLDEQQLVFVEVRYRQHQEFGGALASVDLRKQQKIIRAAQLYLQKHYGNRPPSCRFDVIAMQGDDHENPIQWIKNAFGGG